MVSSDVAFGFCPSMHERKRERRGRGGWGLGLGLYNVCVVLQVVLMHIVITGEGVGFYLGIF